MLIYICFMDKLGRVIFLDKEDDNGFIKHDLISVEYEYTHSDVPTLIVGFNMAKKIFPNINILDKKINNNTFVTFSPSELNIAYRDDLDYFLSHLYNNIIKEYEYKFIDIIIDGVNKYRDISNFYIKNRNTCIYQNDSFIYILDDRIKTIYGLDLNYMCELNINIDDFLFFIKSKTDRFYIDTNDSDGFLMKYESIFERTIEPKFLTVFLNNND